MIRNAATVIMSPYLSKEFKPGEIGFRTTGTMGMIIIEDVHINLVICHIESIIMYSN